MRLRYLLLLIPFVALSCASSKYPQAALVAHPDDKGIPAIDEAIVEMKREYIRECYIPVASHEVPETKCQTELFQLLERRYRLSFKQVHVDMASDELFFREVSDRIRSLVRTDPTVRQLARSNFRSQEELLSYYKNLYGFNAITSSSSPN